MDEGHIRAKFQDWEEGGAGFVVVVEVFVLGEEAEGVAECCLRRQSLSFLCSGHLGRALGRLTDVC